MESLFSVLSKPYCNYFYFLSVLGYFFFILISVSTVYLGYKDYKENKRMSAKFYMSLISISGYFILYFQNRLLYSMCASSLT